MGKKEETSVLPSVVDYVLNTYSFFRNLLNYQIWILLCYLFPDSKLTRCSFIFFSAPRIAVPLQKNWIAVFQTVWISNRIELETFYLLKIWPFIGSSRFVNIQSRALLVTCTRLTQKKAPSSHGLSGQMRNHVFKRSTDGNVLMADSQATDFWLASCNMAAWEEAKKLTQKIRQT